MGQWLLAYDAGRKDAPYRRFINKQGLRNFTARFDEVVDLSQPSVPRRETPARMRAWQDSPRRGHAETIYLLFSIIELRLLTVLHTSQPTVKCDIL